MEVTIEVKEIVVPPYREEVRTRKALWTGKEISETFRIPQKESHTWDVHLTLVPSEEERAVLLKFKIHEQWIEEVLAYTEEEIDRARSAWLNSSNRDLQRSSALQEAYETKKAAMRQILIQEYFNNPYVRSFDHIQKAHDYIDRLKEEILPTIKSRIDHYTDRTERQNFSL